MYKLSIINILYFNVIYQKAITNKKNILFLLEDLTIINL